MLPDNAGLIATRRLTNPPRFPQPVRFRTPHCMSEPEPESSSEAPQPLSLRELAGSVAAAAVGVQSNRNRERDFRRGRARQYVVMGLVGTLLFVLVVYGAVQLVLKLAAS